MPVKRKEMLYKTQGIVLHSLPYKDVYTILHIYTKDFGRVSYLVARKKRKRTSLPQALFMPLSVLDLEVEHLNKRDIQRIKEAHLVFSASSFQADPVKNVLDLFLSEVLFRVMRDMQPDERMYSFLTDSIRILDTVDRGLANFHVAFLLNLLHYLGIFPNVEHQRDSSFFDMLNGIFVGQQPAHPYYLRPAETVVFRRLLKMSYENMSLYAFSRRGRVRILRRIFEYYQLHLPDFREIRSLQVLQALFD